jgi:hypothetical protein
MKIVQSFAISAFVLLSIQTISAQYGNNGYGGGGYGGNGYGGSGRMNSGMNQVSHDSPKEIPVEETVGKIMIKLKPALSLDELQEIAISNILIESFRSQTAIIKSKNSSDADKAKEFQTLSEITERRVNELLSSDQKEKYIVFSEESKNPKKSKKNR